jgi:hypothetical protein
MVVVAMMMVIVATIAAVSVAVVVMHIDPGCVPVGIVRVPSLIARVMRTGRLRRRAQQAENSGTNREEDGNRPT